MDEITIPDDLSGMSVSELEGLLGQINEAGTTVADAAKEAEGEERKELVGTLNSLKAAQEKVSAALGTAREVAAEEDAAIADAGKIFGEDDEADDEEEVVDPKAEEDDEETETEETEAVAASGKFALPKRRNRAIPAARQQPSALVNPFFSTSGDSVESLAQLGEMFQRADKAASLNGDGMARVARLRRATTDDSSMVVSSRNTSQRNTEIMEQATVSDTDVIAAAGGFCGPGEIITDIVQCGRTDRPIGARIPGITARGQYTYMHQLGLEDVEAGIGGNIENGIYTNADDVAVDPLDEATWKACYHLECQADTTAFPYAIPMCFQYGTFQQWSYPEQVSSALAKFDVAMARRSEAVVLQRIHEQSNQFGYTPPVGESVTNSTVRLIGQLLELAGYNGRNDLDGYLLAVPDALLLRMLVDSKIKAWVGPTLSRQDILNVLIDTFQIDMVASPDVRLRAPAPVEPLPAAPAPAGGAMPQYHTRLEVQLFKPSDFRHGVTDVDVVVQTDIATARRNDKSVFLETIETVEKLGCSPSFSVLMQSADANGTQPDLVAFDAAYNPGPTPNPYGVAPIGFPGTPLA